MLEYLTRFNTFLKKKSHCEEEL